MSAWKFSFYRTLKLRLIKNHVNKMRVTSHKLKSECVSEILDNYDSFQKKFAFLKEKLIVKSKKLTMINSDRDDMGKIVTDVKGYTQKEIENLKGVYRMYWFILILFIGAEMGLYMLTIEVIMMNAPLILKIFGSLLLAFIGIFLFNMFFERHFEYVYAKSNRQKLNLSDADISTKKLMAIGGYILGFIGLVLIVLAALVRIMYIENIDTTGMTESEISFANKMNLIIALLMLFLTVAVAIGLALFKKANHDNLIEYKNSKRLDQTLQKINKLKQAFVELKQNIDQSYKDSIEKYWQLLKELKRIWGIDVDQDNNDLYKELKTEKYNGTFVVTPRNYDKYEEIINTDKTMFEYAVCNETEIDKILKSMDEQFSSIMMLFVKT